MRKKVTLSYLRDQNMLKLSKLYKIVLLTIYEKLSSELCQLTKNNKGQ